MMPVYISSLLTAYLGRRVLAEHMDAGVYINFVSHGEGEDRLRVAYGDNYEHLREIKARYDPENFFHVNQNIKPSV
jgi:FAD/FMN-containing dehydrogenase